MTGNKCLIDTFDRNYEFSVEHVALAKQADLVLLAPATANVIGKIANGIADVTGTVFTNIGGSNAVLPVTSVTSAPLNIAFFAMAYPIFPVE